MKIETISKKLSKLIIEKSEEKKEPFLVGLSGGQGSGKSTLSKKLGESFAHQKVSYCILSLDDFYLSKDKRAELASRVHPLATTRGVPGTHDVQLLKKVLTKLGEKDPRTKIVVPTFSKINDDLLPKENWRIFEPRPRVILIEGWCVGAKSSFLTSYPETPWEKEHDSKGLWKSWTREESIKYEVIWKNLDFLILIKQDNFEQVVENRWEQEQKNFSLAGIKPPIPKEKIREFCSHYESWTLGLWKHLPKIADLTIKCAQNYNYSWPKKENNF